MYFCYLEFRAKKKKQPENMNCRSFTTDCSRSCERVSIGLIMLMCVLDPNAGHFSATVIALPHSVQLISRET